MCDDYPDQGYTVPTLHDRIDANQHAVIRWIDIADPGWKIMESGWLGERFQT